MQFELPVTAATRSSQPQGITEKGVHTNRLAAWGAVGYQNSILSPLPKRGKGYHGSPALQVALPKGPFRTKNSTAPESVVFCYCHSFSLSVPFSLPLSLEKQALLSPLRIVLLVRTELSPRTDIHSL